MPDFKIHSPYQMAGDQPEAVAKLVEGINNGLTEQTLMGVTCLLYTSDAADEL